jgi:mRNA deadenylase 3'-5' endonuclease subunit Ccr4
MQIKVYPEDLIKRCLWDSYVYYILGSEKEAEKILKENKEMDITERDALIIGLLKTIETDNLIHKFNSYVIEILTNKSIHSPQKDGLLIRKKTFDTAIDKFVDKFPDYWYPSTTWTNSLKDLIDYIANMKKEVEALEIHKIVDKNITYEFYNSNSIKKMLKFNY